MSVTTRYNDKLKAFEIFPKAFPAFMMTVPDSQNGIFFGNSVVDAVTAREMADALNAAANQFEALRNNV